MAVTDREVPAEVHTRNWLLERIGTTPLLPIGRIPGLTRARVWAQCELFAPTGSHKDHMYLEAIQELERSGRLTPGQIILDYSSGNGGAALAYVAGLFGYEAIIIRPEGMSRGKAAQIAAFGGRLVETPAHQGVEGAVQGARCLAEALGDRAVFIDQGEQEYNSHAYRLLGERVVAELHAHEVKPTHFVCSLGTGGTFSGIAAALREAFDSVQCIAVDVEGETTYAHTFGGHVLTSVGHGLEGISTGHIFSQADEELIDRFIVVQPSEAAEACRRLWSHAFVFAGLTSGANLAAAAKLGASGEVVTVFFDTALKYIDDAELFDRPLRDRRAKLTQILDWLQLGADSAQEKA
ncbi:MAG: PLP-dependent cysteine synthase family protein [Egibacteraceae bacterium]